MERSVHHLFFDRKAWALRPDGQRIRESRPFMVRMDNSAHNELHRVCPPVPVPDYFALQRISRSTNFNLPTLEAVDSLRFATEEAIRHPKAHDIEKALAGLMLDAIDVQMPFVRDALQTWRVYA